MKQIVVAVLAATACVSSAIAGTSTTAAKEMAAATPSPTWYADREWNINLWGSYAFTQHDYPTLDNAFLTEPNFPQQDHDRYLEADHAWGGGVDAKFFFARYFGIGLEGYALDVRQSFPDSIVDFNNLGRSFARTGHDEQAIGAALSTFTFRYPISSSRFAPYLFGGGGAIFGGGQPSRIVITPSDVAVSKRGISETELVAQVGAGMEVRLTPHVGIISDFTWNIVDGPRNDFGMVRIGINFAF